MTVTIEPNEDARPVLAEADHERTHRLRWLILGVLGLAQLMIVLDATIVTIALPDAQQDLGFGDSSRQWIVTAYALAFGSLLLLGGRLSDMVGRRLTLIVGLVGFAVMSALGGLATNFEMLVTARAGQGVFAALLAPAALSLLTTTFTDAKERATAFGVFGAIAGSGGALGLLLGGVLTQTVSWRWTLLVNLFIAAIAIAGAVAFVSSSKADDNQRLDIRGAILAAVGLFAVVYGFSNAEHNGWGDWATITWLVLGAVLLVAFVYTQSITAHALLPLRVLADRDRGGSFLVMFISGVGIFAVFLFLTYYMQQNLGYSPIKSGAAFLPMVGAMIVSSTVASTQLLPRLGLKPLAATGMFLAAIGLALLAQLSADSTYITDILPGLIIVGLAMGAIFAPAMQGAITGIDAEDAGVASALVNTMQQVGGSVGTALLSTIAASALTDYAATHNGDLGLAAIHSYTTAFWWSAAIFAFGGIVAAAVMRNGKPAPAPEGVVVHVG